MINKILKLLQREMFGRLLFHIFHSFKAKEKIIVTFASCTRLYLWHLYLLFLMRIFHVPFLFLFLRKNASAKVGKGLPPPALKPTRQGALYKPRRPMRFYTSLPQLQSVCGREVRKLWHYWRNCPVIYFWRILLT